MPKLEGDCVRWDGQGLPNIKIKQRKSKTDNSLLVLIFDKYHLQKHENTKYKLVSYDAADAFQKIWPRNNIS